MDTAAFAEKAVEGLSKAGALSAGEQEKIYLKAYNAYMAGLFEEAAGEFKSLVAVNPYEYRFWAAFAASRQMSKDLAGALHSWAVAALIDEKSAEPHLHAAECLFLLGDKQEALKALFLAKERAADDEAMMKKIIRMEHECC